MFTHWARLLDHGKGTIKSISIQKLVGTRKSFDVADGFVPVDPRDVETLKSFRENGEPTWRGGAGRPLFEVGTTAEAHAIAVKEWMAKMMAGPDGRPNGNLALLAAMSGGLPPDMTQMFSVPPLMPGVSPALAQAAAAQGVIPPAPNAVPQVPAPVAAAPAPAPAPASGLGVQFAPPPAPSPAPTVSAPEAPSAQPRIGQRRRKGGNGG